MGRPQAARGDRLLGPLWAIALAGALLVAVAGAYERLREPIMAGGNGSTIRHHAPSPVAVAVLRPGPAASPASYPLAVAPGRRHLVDRQGRPFLILGDAAWSLIAQLKREDVDLYLNDRRSRGFNTLLVSLLEHRFATNAPANAYGEPPFSTTGDYATPNERYFAHADWVLSRARELGFVVLLAPSYTGAKGGPEGWYQEMAANGPAKLLGFGRYVGRRYRDYPNIVWVAAGDYDPPDKELSRAVATGIHEADPDALQTAHGAPGTAALDYWQGEPWLQVNNVYTYDSVPAAALEQYARPERMPFFLMESKYENEQDVTHQELRAQAYGAALSGAAGQIFGSNPIWHFDGPGIYPTSLTWRQAMGDRGTQDITRLQALLTSVPWWTLEPDGGGALVAGGLGFGHHRAGAARAADGSFAVVYVPSSRGVTLRLGTLAGPRLTAAWYDPADGRLLDVPGEPFPAAGSRAFAMDAANSAGAADWVLILRSRP